MEAFLSDTKPQGTLPKLSEKPNLTQKPSNLIDGRFGFVDYNFLTEEEPQWRLECQRTNQPERETTIAKLERRRLARVAGVKLREPPLKQGPIVTIVL